jgi:hypothetical protein
MCSHCHQSLPRLFKHNLSRGLVNFLWFLYRAKKPTKLADLGLDNNTFANAHKTAYFKLAYSDAGKWRLTERGFLFLGNQIAVEHSVFTRDAKVVDRSEDTIKVSDVDEGWQTKLDYAREARAVNG